MFSSENVGNTTSPFKFVGCIDENHGLEFGGLVQFVDQDVAFHESVGVGFCEGGVGGVRFYGDGGYAWAGEPGGGGGEVEELRVWR